MAVLYMFFLATACPPDLKIFHVEVLNAWVLLEAAPEEAAAEEGATL